MSIALGSVLTSAGTTSVSSFTYAFNNVAGNIVWVASGVHTNDVETGVTYGGQAMTLAVKNNDVLGGGRWAYLWYLVSPPTGSNNVVITASGTMDVLESTAVSYSGAKQTGQPDSTATNTSSSGTSLTASLTTVADNSWAIIVSRNEAVSAPSAGTGVTQRGSVRTQFFIGDSNGALTPAGSHSMTVNYSNAVTGAVVIAASFSPTVATPASQAAFLLNFI